MISAYLHNLELLKINQTQRKLSQALFCSLTYLCFNYFQTDTGTLKVSGFVRGQPLSVNGLVHLPGYGDFQMSQIEQLNDPYPIKATKQHKNKQVNSLYKATYYNSSTL